MNEAIDQGVEGEIGALSDPRAGVKTIAHLADENVSGPHLFAAESFYATTLCIAVATVSAGTLSFFVCHEITSPHLGAIRELQGASGSRCLVV